MEIEVKVLDKELYRQLPKPATTGSAGIDLICSQEVALEPEATIMVGTGLALWIGSASMNYAGLVLPRSGLGHKHGLVLGNTVGLIDADYQGELKVSCHNRGHKSIHISRGERFAQLVVLPVIAATLKEVEDFSDNTERGKGGFGSTGVGSSGQWVNSWESNE
jgi:dUTP pyrophosphatase